MQAKHCTSFEYSLVQEIDSRLEIGSRVAPACNFRAVHVIDDVRFGSLAVTQEPSMRMAAFGRIPDSGWLVFKGCNLNVRLHH